MMDHAVEEGVFPGAVLLVARRGKILFHEAFGYASLQPKKVSLSRSTRFDLASLSKALATTTALMWLVDRGEISISDPLHKWFPDFEQGLKKKIRLFHLLSHSSGLRAWRPYYRKYFKNGRMIRSNQVRNEIYDRLHKEGLSYRPGSRSLYSDLGFILAGEIIEKVSGRRLDDFCEKEIFGPLKLRTLTFRGSDRTSGPKPLFAATESCPWRGRVLRGEVHDGNAYALGGVAGHAGLFGTAEDVYRLTQVILDAAKGDSKYLSPGLVKRFVRRAKIPGSSWGLGWDTPSDPSSSGLYLSSLSFGHLGFTGCSIWADRRRELIIVLLSNRIHPSSRNIRIRAFRPKIHDRIYRELIK